MMKRMESAIRSVVNKEMGLLKTLKAHHVPKGTLKEYVNRICKRNLQEKEIASLCSMIRLDRRTVLPPCLELELVDYIV